MEQRGLVFEENRVGKGELGRGVAPAPGTGLPGVLAALEQPPNNFPAPPQTFPSAGEAPPPPRAPAEHPPGAAGAAAGKGRARRGREGAPGCPIPRRAPSQRLGAAPRPGHAPCRRSQAGGTRCPGHPARERGSRERGKRGAIPTSRPW